MLKAAFTDGGEWSEAVRAYIADNFAIFRNRIDALPGIRVMDMQCTYLAWVDFAGTGMTETEVRKRLAEDACIASSPGRDFGAGGETLEPLQHRDAARAAPAGHRTDRGRFRRPAVGRRLRRSAG